MSMLDTLSVSKYIAACAKRSGINVVWEHGGGGGPRTDGQTMWIPYIGVDANRDDIVKLMQFVKHETSHLNYSDFSILAEKNPQGLLMFAANCIEDHRVDWLNDYEFEGDRWNTQDYMSIFEREAEGKTFPPEHRDVLAALMAWDTDVREDLWTPVGIFHKLLSEQGKVYYDKLTKGDYSDVLRNIRLISDPVEGSAATYALAQRIVKEVYEQDPKSMEQPKKPEKGDKGEGEGDGKENGEGEGEGEGGGEDGEGEVGESDMDTKGGKGGKGGPNKLRDIDYKGAMAPYAEHVPGKKGKGVNAKNYTCGVDKGYTPTPLSEIMLTNFVTGEGVAKNKYVGRYGDDSETIEKLTHNADAIANSLRTQLQIISRDRWEFGKKKGKLNGSALYRVGLKDAKGFNERIFKQQITNDTLDVAVQVLVDCSGSMSGTKFEAAAAAAVILNDVLGNTLRIPTEVLGFTEYGSTHAMYVFKEFDRVEAKPTILKNFGKMGGALSDNVDGESLAFGFDRLRKRKEKRKLMIVLSDGSPCGGHHKGRTIQHTRDVIKAIESSPVELIGVGIMYDGVKGYYKKHAKIDEAKDIGSSLITLISKNILKEG